MLEKIKTFGLWFLIAIAIIGSVVLPIIMLNIGT